MTTSRPFFALLLIGVLSCGLGAPAAAQSTGAAATDSSRHPNRVPYETDRSVGYHVLSAPAYVLHGVTRPIGWTIKWVERRFPSLFQPTQPVRGFLPLVEIGGPAGFLVGGALYDNQLFGTDQRARIEGLFGASDTFEIQGTYSAPLGTRTRFEVVGNFFSQPEDGFFIRGNRSDETLDEGEFFRQQLDIDAHIDYNPPGPFRGSAALLYEHVDADEEDGPRGQTLIDADLPGFDSSNDFLTPRLRAAFDFTEGQPRTYRGTKLSLRADYTHDLNGDRFRYGRYVAQVEQYLPVGVFPKSRRLALRARAEQVEPLFGGEAVPFYQLPLLGGPRSLRGVQYDRFRDDGSVLLSAEYRYPIWRMWDAVVFTDTGQVFEAWEDVAVSEFQWSYGTGIHLLGPKGLTFRFEVANSEEGLQTILTVNPSFRTTAR
jgi:outer membrane protein assembly factor BamA